jgi:hypothetical protein
MSPLQQAQDRNTLLLTHVDFGGVEFDLLNENDERVRTVRVNVASGTSWRTAVRFPDFHGEASTSTGDAELDRQICERAAEELVRLEAATVAWRAVA